MSERDCNEAATIAALFDGRIDESTFLSRMFRDHDKDYLEIIAIIVEARARECGNA